MQIFWTAALIFGIAIALFGRRSQFDFEEEPWRSLRPEAFEPLADVADVRHALDAGVEMFAAMPGMGAAMEFAQRLGIGRHIPCLLVFTEIGALHQCATRPASSSPSCGPPRKNTMFTPVMRPRNRSGVSS